MNLRLDDDRSPETAGDLARFGRRERDLALRDGHPVPRQNRLRLVLVHSH